MGAADVKLVCLEQRHEMPAFRRELDEALEEGIAVENGWGPTSFVRDGDSIRVTLQECSSVFDERGRFRPKMNPRNAKTLTGDSVVVAVGQRSTPGGIPSELLQGKRLAVDPVTLQAERGGRVFVCGDALTGPGSVVEAMAQAREAAVSMDRALRGETLDWGRDYWQTRGSLAEYTADRSRSNGVPRGRLPRLPKERRTLEREVEKSLSPKAARREADRCISCGRAAEWNRTCWYCLPCEIECPTQALEVRIPYLVR
jgi:NADPH-dependent glutamate synthase beta subunit-like oxidoreductase